MLRDHQQKKTNCPELEPFLTTVEKDLLQNITFDKVKDHVRKKWH